MPVMKLLYGLHQPGYVSDNEVVRYAEKLDWQGDIFRLKDYAEETRSKYRYLGNSIPDVLIFNSNGLLTKYEIDCSSDLDSIAMLSIETINSMKTGEKSFRDFIADTYVINSLDVEEMIAFNTPTYVVKFAEFAGKLNKENVPEQIRLLRNRSEIKYVLLNMDYTTHE